jgi:hypothetical protein
MLVTTAAFDRPEVLTAEDAANVVLALNFV